MTINEAIRIIDSMPFRMDKIAIQDVDAVEEVVKHMSRLENELRETLLELAKYEHEDRQNHSNKPVTNYDKMMNEMTVEKLARYILLITDVECDLCPSFKCNYGVDCHSVDGWIAWLNKEVEE